MAKQTVVLKPSQEVKIGEADVKVLKCGMHKEGDEPARPTVTLEVDGEVELPTSGNEDDQPAE